MVDATPLDSGWLRDHPLPSHDPHADKNARGRVFAVGGCRSVPGGLLLTAEAALRAGAGKVQAAVPESTALALGVAMPEMAVFGLAENGDGEIAGLTDEIRAAMARSHAIVAGPAMSCETAGGDLVDDLLDGWCDDTTVVLDAAALMKLAIRREALSRRTRPAILTPHIGEMAAMLACAAEEIAQDRAGAVLAAARGYGAVVALKGSTTMIADRDGALFAYSGGGVGLATGGSGDVLAGIAAGIAARDGSALDATLWAVWLHGEAGRRCAEQIGPVGFLARELLAHVPGLLHAL